MKIVELNEGNALRELMERVGMTEEKLRSKSRVWAYVDARSMLAAMLMEVPGMRQVDVASMMGVTQAGVSKMLARHRVYLRFNAPYRKKWYEVAGVSKAV